MYTSILIGRSLREQTENYVCSRRLYWAWLNFNYKHHILPSTKLRLSQIMLHQYHVSITVYDNGRFHTRDGKLI